MAERPLIDILSLIKTTPVIAWLALATFAFPAPAVRSAEPAFLAPPQYTGPPKPEHAATNRAFQGIPSMAVAPGGRLWADWYAGVTPGEDQNNYVVVSSSGDRGATWQEVLVIDPDGDGPVRAYDPQLWMSPDGRLFVFWTQAEGHLGTIGGVWCMETSELDAANPRWSAPRRLTDGVMMDKPLVLSSGEWVLPASTWRETDRSARMIVSTDHGKTWSLRGACNVPKNVRAFDEHLFIERKDSTLWLLVRTSYGIGESISTDRGKTWPELTPTAIAHPSSRFSISRLASGHLLLVKHGPVAEKTGRSHLTAFVSADDGKTWKGGLLLDERTGVSYPDGQQSVDGLIRIIYDFSRTDARQILMAAFREEDIVAGKDVSGAVRLRQLVSEGSGGRQKPKAASQPVEANADGEPLRTQTPGRLHAEGVQAETLIGGALLFTDRKYDAAELPGKLPGAQSLRLALEGTKTVTCDRAGTVWILTPTPARNGDSQTKALLKQGFQKVALPELRLFDPTSTRNFSTLYQKDCVAGETLTLGKWAVPVFLP